MAFNEITDLTLLIKIRFILVQNRQGKTRLAKWYAPFEDDEKLKMKSEIHRLVGLRDQKYQSNFAEVKIDQHPRLCRDCLHLSTSFC